MKKTMTSTLIMLGALGFFVFRGSGGRQQVSSGYRYNVLEVAHPFPFALQPGDKVGLLVRFQEDLPDGRTRSTESAVQAAVLAVGSDGRIRVKVAKIDSPPPPYWYKENPAMLKAGDELFVRPVHILTSER